MSSISSILNAANTLSRISDVDRETLLPHRDKLETAFRNLQSLLRTGDGIGDDTLCPGSGSLVMKYLEKNEKAIREWFSRADKPDKPTFGDWADEDPRVVDVSITDNDSSLDTKFRSGLCDHLNSGNRSSMYKEYVDQSDNFRDKEKAKRSIEYGVKYLVFGKIFLHHVQVYAGDIPTHVHFGVLGILFLTKFRRLKYSDIPLLANAILSSDWRKLAEEKTEWVSSRLKLNDHRVEQILAHRRSKHNLEEEIPYENRNKRPRNESTVAITSNDAALQNSLGNLLQVDPLGLPYFDYTLDRDLNSRFSAEHARSQEHNVQDYARRIPLL